MKPHALNVYEGASGTYLTNTTQKDTFPKNTPVPIKTYLLDGMSNVSGATLILPLAGQKGIVDVKEDGDNLW